MILRGTRLAAWDLLRIWRIEAAPGAVADVKHLHHLLLLKYLVDNSINVRLVAVKQMPKLIIFLGCRASTGKLTEAVYRLF